jgi:hypothetical protein
MMDYSYNNVVTFFARSDWLDYAVLRRLSHVAGNWELTYDGDFYKPEDDSLADHLNVLIEEIGKTFPPKNYHHYENILASQHYDTKSGGVILSKSKRIWLNSATKKPIPKEQLGFYIEQGAIGNSDVPELVIAAAGRIATAMKHGVEHFDDLDSGHMSMLAEIMTIILFVRSDYPARS